MPMTGGNKTERSLERWSRYSSVKDGGSNGFIFICLLRCLSQCGGIFLPPLHKVVNNEHDLINQGKAEESLIHSSSISRAHDAPGTVLGAEDHTGPCPRGAFSMVSRGQDKGKTGRDEGVHVRWFLFSQQRGEGAGMRGLWREEPGPDGISCSGEVFPGKERKGNRQAALSQFEDEVMNVKEK